MAEIKEHDLGASGLVTLAALLVAAELYYCQVCHVITDKQHLLKHAQHAEV